jgi:hypothetical protein
MARAIAALVQRLDLDATADGGRDLFRVGDEIVDDLMLGREAIGIDAGESHVGKSVVPGRPVGNERIPPFRAPALRDPMALDDEMRRTALPQVRAHCEPGLTATDDERIDFHD